MKKARFIAVSVVLLMLLTTASCRLLPLLLLADDPAKAHEKVPAITAKEAGVEPRQTELSRK